LLDAVVQARNSIASSWWTGNNYGSGGRHGRATPTALRRHWCLALTPRHGPWAAPRRRTITTSTSTETARLLLLLMMMMCAVRIRHHYTALQSDTPPTNKASTTLAFSYREKN